MYCTYLFINLGHLQLTTPGEVTYKIDGFIAKNNDSLQDDLVELLLFSTNIFLIETAKVGVEAVGGGGATVKKSDEWINSSTDEAVVADPVEEKNEKSGMV